MTAPLQTVHVRVNDAASGRPTPCRVRFTDAAGTYHAPFGRMTRFSDERALDGEGSALIAGEPHAYIDGACEVRLPAGPVHVAISKGPEFQPIATQVNLPPGKLALRFDLERWADLRAQGWYSGDTHCYSLTPHAALLEGAGEDLAVVNLLARESWFKDEDSRFWPVYPNITAFSGQRPALEMPGHLVAVNTMNMAPRLGRLLLLHCHRVVYPLLFGFGPEDFESWTLAAWCDQCHRKGGLVVGDNFFFQSGVWTHGELLADLVLGKIDALALDDFEQPDADSAIGPALEEWYTLLDCGYRIPLAGGSGKGSCENWLGSIRTYARLGPGQEFTYRNWIEAVRAGRTFVTTGPLLSLTVDEADPGAVLHLSPEKAIVHVHATARSLTPYERLEVVFNRAVMASATPAGSPPSASIEADIPISRSGWVAARCVESWREGQAVRTGAQTSPVYVEVPGRPRQADRSAVARLLGDLDRTLEWIRTEARCETDKQRQDLTAVFESARQELLQRQS